MARLPALVEALAEVDLRSHATLNHIARLVRDAGEITSTKRGAGGAKMEYRDAATLLMAACGDINPLGAVAAAKRMQALEPIPADAVRAMQREDLPAHFDWLREPTSFAATLTRLIEHAPQLVTWEAAYQAGGAEGVGGGASEAEFSVTRAISRFAQGGFQPGLSKPVRVIFYAPGIAAEIHLGWVWDDLTEADAFHEYYAAPQAAGQVEGPHEPAPDVMFPVEIGVRTLLALHHAVNQKPRTRGPAKNPRKPND